MAEEVAEEEEEHSCKTGTAANAKYRIRLFKKKKNKVRPAIRTLATSKKAKTKEKRSATH